MEQWKSGKSASRVGVNCYRGTYTERSQKLHQRKMTTAVMLRIATGLAPTDEFGEKALANIPLNDLVKVKITRSRNLQHHRLFFAVLQKVWDNQSHYKSVEHLLFALKIRLGYVDEVVMRDGIHLMPTSIAFHKMDQTTFRVFFDCAIDFLCTEVIPGLNRRALLNEIAEMLHSPSPSNA